MYRFFIVVGSILFLLMSSTYAYNRFTRQSNSFFNIDFQDKWSRDTLQIDTVSVSRELLTADSMFRLKQKEHRQIYLWGDDKKPFQINPFGGILININKVYSHFSKKGKQSRRLQSVFKRELNEDLVNGIWKPYTIKYTNLRGDSLFVFQTYFRPDYKSFSEASHYEKLYFINQSMRLYRDSTSMIHDTLKLPNLIIKSDY